MDAQKKYEMMMQNPMMQNPTTPNPTINMNEQNNFYNYDLTNKMDNLFIVNQGYNNNGNMAMKQNQIEKKKLFLCYFQN